MYNKMKGKAMNENAVKKQIKMKIIDCCKDDTEENFYKNPFVKLLLKNFDIVYSNQPDYVLCFSELSKFEFLQYNCVRIFCATENISINWDIYDYATGYYFMDYGDRYFRFPTLSFQCNFDDDGFDSYAKITPPPIHIQRDKFCGVMWSNSGSSDFRLIRNDFFDKLNQYKHIDSGGKWRNNIGGLIDEQYKTKEFLNNKIKWLQNYKFNICFENSSYPGFLTEKLFDAYTAGCIPIYWGDTSLRVGLDNMKDGDYDPNDPNSIDMRIPKISENLIDYKINPKAFINAHNFPNLDALVEEVKRIDNDDKLYEAMRKEPLFLDNFNPKDFYEKKLFDFFYNIFSQPLPLAFRRGDSQHKRWWFYLIRDLIENRIYVVIWSKTMMRFLKIGSKILPSKSARRNCRFFLQEGKHTYRK